MSYNLKENLFLGSSNFLFLNESEDKLKKIEEETQNINLNKHNQEEDLKMLINNKSNLIKKNECDTNGHNIYGLGAFSKNLKTNEYEQAFKCTKCNKIDSYENFKNIKTL
jgi:hypothetical protein